MEHRMEVKVGVLHPIQEPKTHWDRFSAFSLVRGPTHAEVTACDDMANLLTHQTVEYLGTWNRSLYIGGPYDILCDIIMKKLVEEMHIITLLSRP